MPLTKVRIIVAITLRVMDSLNAVNNVGHFRSLEKIHHAERDGYGNTKRLLSRASIHGFFRPIWTHPSPEETNMARRNKHVRNNHNKARRNVVC